MLRVGQKRSRDNDTEGDVRNEPNKRRKTGGFFSSILGQSQWFHHNLFNNHFSALETALHYGLDDKARVSAEYLLQANAHQAIVDAARAHHPEMLQFFKSLGADIDVLDEKGRTPLWNIILDCPSNHGALQLLVASNANIEAAYRRYSSDKLRTPLNYVAQILYSSEFEEYLTRDSIYSTSLDDFTRVRAEKKLERLEDTQRTFSKLLDILLEAGAQILPPPGSDTKGALYVEALSNGFPFRYPLYVAKHFKSMIQEVLDYYQTPGVLYHASRDGLRLHHGPLKDKILEILNERKRKQVQDDQKRAFYLGVGLAKTNLPFEILNEIAQYSDLHRDTKGFVGCYFNSEVQRLNTDIENEETTEIIEFRPR